MDGIYEFFIAGTGKDREGSQELEFDLGIYEKNGKFLIVSGGTTGEHFNTCDKTFTKILETI